MVCDVALADFFSDVAPVCLIIGSIVLLIIVYRLTVASLVDCEGAKAKAQFSQRISRECFRSALLPFSDQFRSVRLNGFAFTRRRHVTLNGAMATGGSVEKSVGAVPAHAVDRNDLQLRARSERPRKRVALETVGR